MRELDKVIGYENIKNELYRIIDIILNPEKYRALGVSVPKGILLSGDPGIGKSLMAKCFIAETGRKSYIVRKDKPNGTFVDYIRETFDKAAEDAPSVILLDDMDKFANEDIHHRDAEEYVTVQACIDDVKDKDVFVIATCNDDRKLPASLVRNGRFDKIFMMDFPENKDAEKIISFYLADKMVADDIDIEEIARFSAKRSCADLESVINEAGSYAGFDNRTVISQEDIIRACLIKFHDVGDVLPSDPDVVRRIAVHEAGHVVASELLGPGQVTFVSVIGNSLFNGCVFRPRARKGSTDIKDWEAEIMINLAGKASTEIILSETDMGSNNDLQLAFNITRTFLDNNASYDFNSWCHGPETSQHIFDHLDSVTGAEVSRYYLKTKELLGKNRVFLEAVIEALIEKHTLSYKDLAAIREDVYKNVSNVA